MRLSCSMLKRPALSLVLGLLVAVVVAQGKPGDVAPTPTVKAWIGSAWSGPAKGRVTVVEFWAPWCGPCVAAFPHLNALVDAMKGEPVDFVSITDEPEAKVRAFLEKRPLKTHVALDTDGKTFTAYGASVIPHTAIVGPDGRIVAITRPESVTAEMLRAVLAGKDPKVESVQDVAADVEWDAKAGLAPDTALSLSVLLPSPATSGAVRPSKPTGRIVADGVGIRDLLKLAYDAPFDTVRGDLPKAGTPMRVSIKAPDGKYETALAMLRMALEGTFGITAHWETVERTVPVLRRNDAPLALAVSKSEASGCESRMGSIKATRETPEYIAQMVGLFSWGQKAVDETGLTGLYDMDLEWTPSDRASFDASLAKLGFTLIKAPRKIRELVVDRKR